MPQPSLLCIGYLNDQSLSRPGLKTPISRMHGERFAPWATRAVKKLVSEVGFEPTPGEPDCDLNAAP